MTVAQRIDLLVQLGKYLAQKGDYLQAVIHRSEHHNAWFTKAAQHTSIDAIVQHFLQREKLEKWVQQYHLDDYIQPRKVGLVMAGNIPLVGMHDLLAVFVAGHRAHIKLSDKDPYLLPHLLDWMGKQVPAAADYFTIQPTLSGFDAVIATGSNNSARYFETYFQKYPHIIRRNRNSIAILNGTEQPDDLIALGGDIFRYFGLGCRNVSKLYVPRGYDFSTLLETLHNHYKELILHSKYKNNFDYNYAIYMLNKVPFLHNGSLILVEDETLVSRIATLHYEYYDTTEALSQQLQTQQEAIQCLVGKEDIPPFSVLPFGKSQQPELTDYADGIDTMAFLLGLN